ncbi:hypothetical protein F7731_10830 [Cytobacillus depressus]|uniref:Uncharacterized protein n=1 Tax=Cytobacillus depressus TaxID=1602942 RepID=A0A6L3V6E6_9BACI|nr:hypothetical protein [Cytobacillus depressus]KAB2336829.1 hypothetical protein F7731_10830 [Cytobacillus depressus]
MKRERIIKSLLERLSTMALAVVLFAVAFSWVSYVPSSQREPNTYYFGFFETFVFVIIYAGSLYLIAGMPLSVLINKLIRKSNGKSKWERYYIGLGMYSLAGAIVGALFIVFSGDIHWNGFTLALMWGFAASNLYFHLSLLISKINRGSILE